MKLTPGIDFLQKTLWHSHNILYFLNEKVGKTVKATLIDNCVSIKSKNVKSKTGVGLRWLSGLER